MEARILDRGNDLWESRYRNFICKKNLLGSGARSAYASLEWREILSGNLKTARDIYIIVAEKDEIICALPAFITDFPKGNVINSLPTIRGFGGYGGPVFTADESESGWERIKKALKLLYDYIDKIARDNGCVSFTFSTPPIIDSVMRQRYLDAVKENFKADYVSEGFAQISVIDNVFSGKNFSDRVRRSVRKGISAGVAIVDKIDRIILNQMYDYYTARMDEIGVEPKPFAFFEDIYFVMAAKGLARFFAALYDGEHIGGLLVVGSEFQEQQEPMVDYFVPYYSMKHKNLQPSSVAIDFAMKFYKSKGIRYWNWQSSSEKNNSVYNFKAGWGAFDVPYYYFTRIYQSENAIKNLWAENKDRYKWYYVAPFDVFREFRGIYR